MRRPRRRPPRGSAGSGWPARRASSPTSSSVSGSSGIWPEQNSRPPARTAWLYGPTAAGAPIAVTGSRCWDTCSVLLGLGVCAATVDGSVEIHGQRARRRDLALPAAAQGQSRRLAAVGSGGDRARPRTGPAAARLHRLLGLSLVPRHGARVLRERRDRRAHERALRLRQGRPRGAPRRRRDLHGGRAGDDRQRRLAAERLPHARAGPVLRRHVLPARAAPRDAELADGAAGRRAGLGHAARGDPRAERRDGGAAVRGRAPEAGRRARSTPQILDDAVAQLRRAVRLAARRLGRRAEVPRRLDDRVPAAPRRDADVALHAALDGLGRHQRPDRRRLRALLDRRELDGPALREDALRQRAAGRRLPARLAGQRRRRAARAAIRSCAAPPRRRSTGRCAR